MDTFNTQLNAFCQFFSEQLFEFNKLQTLGTLPYGFTTFVSYLLNAFKQIGVQSKPLCERLVMLTYDESSTLFNAEHPVTQFCKSVIFDTVCMRIASLGTTMALSNNTFNTTTNNTIVAYTPIIDGTMLVYNKNIPYDYSIEFAKYIRDANRDIYHVINPYDATTSTQVGDISETILSKSFLIKDEISFTSSYGIP